ncbi:uncharacterized protein CANTADRAFT_127945 [Suhomyces tanzawaensis NRRL Y-17324]|uniref:Uncharacterized protein n=1 Tax=Suhomyces tanzawaensis NRRL Y-17324 TaxID=984487 RepID=A0A1E4SQY3_9ASCO|nr:uncharacterized protein CANTADRAFT_127945 [Suhomyces tanzawaensis NRRL Y-17324]ODV81914.1 hypothetical protein CANTADRAFT_127945 [Suhomyces tanzawaensis NRRL Y-17324]
MMHLIEDVNFPPHQIFSCTNLPVLPDYSALERFSRAIFAGYGLNSSARNLRQHNTLQTSGPSSYNHVSNGGNWPSVAAFLCAWTKKF